MISEFDKWFFRNYRFWIFHSKTVLYPKTPHTFTTQATQTNFHLISAGNREAFLIHRHSAVFTTQANTYNFSPLLTHKYTPSIRYVLWSNQVCWTNDAVLSQTLYYYGWEVSVFIFIIMSWTYFSRSSKRKNRLTTIFDSILHAIILFIQKLNSTCVLLLLKIFLQHEF